ncbi:MAG: helix-turn-helix domain-containing protein [Candidatus Woesearchaeota archaeon]
MDTRIFGKLGFSDGETKVYVALLKLGQTTVGPIIAESRVSGSKVYAILERLMQKGLVSFVIKQKTRFYHAYDPHRLVDYLEEKEREMQTLKIELEKSIPHLSQMHAIDSSRDEAIVFEGWEGVKTSFRILFESLQQGDEYLAFAASSKELQDRNVTTFLKNIHSRRIEKKIRARILANEKSRELLKDYVKLKYCEVRFTGHIVPTDIIIFDNTILFEDYEPPYNVIVVKSAKLSESFRKFFEDTWIEASD